MDDTADTVQKLLKRCSISEVEIEARIRRHLVNEGSQQLLIHGLGRKWETDAYTERRKISKSSRKCAYRQRDYGTGGACTICKSSIAREDVNDAWCTLHVSVEAPAPSMSGFLASVEPTSVVRHRAELEGHYVDVVCSNSEYRVEVEVCDAGSLNVERTLSVVRQVCTLLQGSRVFVGYYDWYAVVHVTKTWYGPLCIDMQHYQKPRTMTMREMLEVGACSGWAVTPKVDGERRFIVAIDERAFSVGLMRDVKSEGSIPGNTGVLILDCEYTSSDSTFHVFDVPVSCSRYVGDLDLESRLGKAGVPFTPHGSPLAHIVVKGRTGFCSFDGLCRLCNELMASDRYTTDGIIFLKEDTGYMHPVYKWKPHSTVDLMVTATHELLTCDNHAIRTPVADPGLAGVAPGIWEFDFDGHLLHPKRPRPDKPQANSRYIVETNVVHAVPGSVFSCVGCYLMRKYHNRVKSRMIRGANDNGAVIMDIGTGQGGDVAKWKRAKRVYCIEPSLQSTDDMRNRHGSIRGVSVHNVPLRDLDLSLINGKVDIFIAFFCMNQFEKADWESLSTAIKSTGSLSCRLLAIAMTAPRSHTGECFDIAMSSDTAYSICIHGTRITGMQETAVSKRLLTSEMAKCGLVLDECETLNSNSFMTKEERALSAMYEALVYKRVRSPGSA